MKDRKQIPYFTLWHCSATAAGNGAQFAGWHQKRGFWSERSDTHIGYHFVIENGNVFDRHHEGKYHHVPLLDGSVSSGRALRTTGAHSPGFNRGTGICFVGLDRFTEPQLRTGRKLHTFMVTEGYAKRGLEFGHYEIFDMWADYYPPATVERWRKKYPRKSCPNMPMDDLRVYLNGGMHTSKMIEAIERWNHG